MLTKIFNFMEVLERSEAFSHTSEIGAPAGSTAVEELVAVLRGLGCQIPPELAELYGRCDGLSLRWHAHATVHPDVLTAGNLQIPQIGDLTASLRYASEDFALLDYISDEYQVGGRVAGGELTLWYYGEDLSLATELPVTVDDYLRLMDQSRGLDRWQEMICPQLRAKMQPEMVRKFALELDTFFPDVDKRSFSL